MKTIKTIKICWRLLFNEEITLISSSVSHLFFKILSMGSFCCYSLLLLQFEGKHYSKDLVYDFFNRKSGFLQLTKLCKLFEITS